MKKNRILLLALGIISAVFNLFAQTATVTLKPTENSPVIPKEIYGQFAEHLGTCIYGGLWVGRESAIPNVDGYRTDVLEALKALKVPVMRWPGGCFADEYHWRDGIGDPSQRPRMVNNNWGGTVEDNSFGTHEFFNLCEMIGAEPYLSGNVGSGTVAELAQWVEYITAEDGPMARLRQLNGREKPWHLKYLGVGNESWGCGGTFTPEYYSDVYRRYQTYCRDYNGNHLYKIASGASDYDYDWTEILMKNAARYMDGISLHYYTVKGWEGSKGSALDFTDEDYYWTLGKCLEIGPVVKKHCDIMDKYDPEKRVGLLVDEWGTWWDEEPGTIKGHLFQQNTMRDAMVAALSLNIFHRFADRVKMANIAQIANVLQSMVLTRGEQMVLTPTYYVFRMYSPFQDARYIPVEVKSPAYMVRDNRKVPVIDASAAEKDGRYVISLVNTHLRETADVEINIGNIRCRKIAGEILTSKKISDYNEFGKVPSVSVREFKDVKLEDGHLKVRMPAKSIVTLIME